ncbi:beta1,4 mannosyltransferase, putative [Perkinsus marinus ATCC 50983]|uniref:Beta1,4 mannosyltransferase, putative n=1 Tax=Perkinsus marinus (strain ATCC 50983 / TXsc) TaxID=423536 RepID=C5L7S0_PERM5|nr:beta1,4 mannosyltransferase, putative [Perkinsus marinus ATCC 50983]EER07532.1 beta1,4 mannosyltransferase, putative [Perkinsus marinus ATCC 50983]|eukprot:XP_002775716.1 beta1,4 mannosyltransferase, putative [Perkinsus marinus ATCC 50983]
MVQYNQRGGGRVGKGKGGRRGGGFMTRRSSAGSWKNSERKGGKGKGRTRKEGVTAEQLDNISQDEALLRYKGEDALAKKYDEDLEKYFERGREKEEQHEHTSDDADATAPGDAGGKVTDEGGGGATVYHSISLAEQADMDVIILGYPGSKPMKEVIASKHITLRYMKPFQSLIILRYIIYALCKLVYEGTQLLWILLFELPPPKLIMVQTPPAIPTLIIASIVTFIRRSKLIVDFHNLAYTILGEKLGPHHLLVRLSHVYEAFWASKYSDRIKLYEKLRSSYGVVEEDLTSDKVITMVSSTSWTPDEDFLMLLPGLVEIDYLLREKDKLLVFFITGKGPCKEAFVRAFEDLRLSNIKLYTPWLSVLDYPLLLGSVDVGISLHQSSSGLDLPMKVVDMLGADLPVIGRDFEAFGELGRRRKRRRMKG